MASPNPFAGTWTLDSWTSLKNGEPVGYPMGEDARGQIIYGDRTMSAFLMRADFPESSGEITPDTFLSYAGNWSIADGRITHLVEFATLPHWVGRSLIRHVDRDGEEMTLRTEPERSKSGSVYQHVLLWRRVGSLG